MLDALIFALAGALLLIGGGYLYHLIRDKPSCPVCQRAWEAHACPAVTKHGEVRCAQCQGPIAKGTLKQHDGTWKCPNCKSGV